MLLLDNQVWKPQIQKKRIYPMYILHELKWFRNSFSTSILTVPMYFNFALLAGKYPLIVFLSVSVLWCTNYSVGISWRGVVRFRCLAGIEFRNIGLLLFQFAECWVTMITGFECRTLCLLLFLFSGIYRNSVSSGVPQSSRWQLFYLCLWWVRDRRLLLFPPKYANS